LVKANEPVEEWTDNQRAQKDVQARWTQKNGKNFFGYKNHIGGDVKHKLIRAYVVTPASAHDSNEFEERSRLRVRVEHIFGAQWQTAGKTLLRCVGITRARVKIGLRNLAYNMARYATRRWHEKERSQIVAAGFVAAYAGNATEAAIAPATANRLAPAAPHKSAGSPILSHFQAIASRRPSRFAAEIVGNRQSPPGADAGARAGMA
jgi:IS5 family transposase